MVVKNRQTVEANLLEHLQTGEGMTFSGLDLAQRDLHYLSF